MAALADRAGYPAAQRGRRAGLRRRGLVHGRGPAGTPQPIVDRLHAMFRAIMGAGRAGRRSTGAGVVPVVSAAAGRAAEFIASETGALGQGGAAGGLAGIAVRTERTKRGLRSARRLGHDVHRSLARRRLLGSLAAIAAGASPGATRTGAGLSEPHGDDRRAGRAGRTVQPVRAADRHQARAALRQVLRRGEPAGRKLHRRRRCR